MNTDNSFNVKAPQDVILDVPQERVTGDILRGYGPRRGNLERLLRYWRPIMRKPGGFRRCRVILANHPELYPLSNICAWLHHETTGLWPNEGCHHPGMKNCRKKLKGIVRGSLLSDSQFNAKLRKLGGKKGLQNYEEDVFFFKGATYDETENPVVTESDIQYAFKVLSDFVLMEKEFVDYIEDDDQWEIVGETDSGSMVKAAYVRSNDCGC